MVPESTVTPIPPVLYLMGLNRIFVHIAKHVQELPKSRHDTREEPFPPHMAHKAMNAVVGHREYAHDPLHQPRQARVAFKSQHDMDVVSHDAEVLDPERILSFPSGSPSLSRGKAPHPVELSVSSCLIERTAAHRRVRSCSASSVLQAQLCSASSVPANIQASSVIAKAPALLALSPSRRVDWELIGLCPHKTPKKN